MIDLLMNPLHWHPVGTFHMEGKRKSMRDLDRLNSIILWLEGGGASFE